MEHQPIPMHSETPTWTKATILHVLELLCSILSFSLIPGGYKFQCTKDFNFQITRDVLKEEIDSTAEMAMGIVFGILLFISLSIWIYLYDYQKKIYFHKYEGIVYHFICFCMVILGCILPLSSKSFASCKVGNDTQKRIMKESCGLNCGVLYAYTVIMVFNLIFFCISLSISYAEYVRASVSYGSNHTNERISSSFREASTPKIPNSSSNLRTEKENNQRNPTCVDYGYPLSNNETTFQGQQVSHNQQASGSRPQLPQGPNYQEQKLSGPQQRPQIPQSQNFADQASRIDVGQMQQVEQQHRQQRPQKSVTVDSSNRHYNQQQQGRPYNPQERQYETYDSTYGQGQCFNGNGNYIETTANLPSDDQYIEVQVEENRNH